MTLGDFVHGDELLTKDSGMPFSVSSFDLYYSY